MKPKTIFLSCFALWVYLSGNLSYSQSIYDKQGIKGCVRLLTGNQMPSPGKLSGSRKGIPAVIYIYPLVTVSETEPSTKACFYKAVHASLVKVIKADSSGYFESLLDTGNYSLFIRIGDLFYACQTDQFNHLVPARVTSSRQTYVELLYKYNVTF
jgi:hypothetical protein